MLKIVSCSPAVGQHAILQLIWWTNSGDTRFSHQVNKLMGILLTVRWIRSCKTKYLVYHYLVWSDWMKVWKTGWESCITSLTIDLFSSDHSVIPFELQQLLFTSQLPAPADNLSANGSICITHLYENICCALPQGSSSLYFPLSC